MSSDIYDLCIIGGGINGAGAARDAAGRGLKVLLLEKDDLASATSSASSKLIHGGLRYLEFYEFRLVRESLKERDVLLNIAPHIIWPMDFVLPHDVHLRPRWMISLGLWLYDFLAGSKRLAKSKAIDLKVHQYGQPLNSKFAKGFRYSDCWVQDSRLVVLNAMDAKKLGAEILTRCECTKLQKKSDHWDVSYHDHEMQAEKTIQAKCIVNASGPWVQQFLENAHEHSAQKKSPNVRLIKGSHIIIPRTHEGEQSYILQQKDGRIVFVIPYENDFTLIGTTDVLFEGNPNDVSISPEEKQYLCECYNAYFECEISPHNVVFDYSGVRPLFDDGEEEARAVTRDYVLYDHQESVPLFSVYGGKITTFRKLSEAMVDDVCQVLFIDKKPWTKQSVLPGAWASNEGDYAQSRQKVYAAYCQRYPWIPEVLLKRYLQNYGRCLEDIIGNAKALQGLGSHYGEYVFEAELDYLIQKEWARTLDDVLFRRSKLGLHIQPDTQKKISEAIASKAALVMRSQKG